MRESERFSKKRKGFLRRGGVFLGDQGALWKSKEANHLAPPLPPPKVHRKRGGEVSTLSSPKVQTYT